MRLILALVIASTTLAAAPGWVLVGWNNLGMHCLDGDFSVFSILPPYNTIHAQLVNPSGKLLTAANGVTVTYQAVQDAGGSINSTSRGKTNFWDYVSGLFGATVAIDDGLAGSSMPGPGNQPRPMVFDSAQGWFIAEGIPLTMYDDAGNRNPYPMMRLTARDAAGNVLATTDIVLPVSDEMDCRTCHASGTSTAARPATGWVSHPLAEKDYKLNILKLHDERTGAGNLYADAVDGRPVLCASCHASNALAGTGIAGVKPLTEALHGFHAHVADPVNGATLDDSSNRSACYRCHPGAETRCLRGAMGKAVAVDGTMTMQCQSCHGRMSAVGAPGRQGWLDEPGCQSCHPGQNTRYTDAFENGQPRVPATTRFATNSNVPAAGLSLYRFSKGHGGLACEACHGSTHAEYPSSHDGDNEQSIAIQGHAGTLSECGSCHAQPPTTTAGGPHGLHTIGSAWVRSHGDVVERSGTAGCQECHGRDLRGSPLSRVLADRQVTAEDYGTRSLWRGYQVSCWLCHNGPGSESRSSSVPPSVGNSSISTRVGTPGSVLLPVTGSGTVRIVTQPANGTVGLSGSSATYYPVAGFEGSDQFTFAATNGSTDSNLGTVQVTVTAQSRPAFEAGAVVNAASFAPGGLAPGEIFTIFGSGMGPGSLTTMQLNSAGWVSRSLSGTRVLFDGLPVPIIYTRADQMSAVAPYSLAGKSTTALQVEYQGIRSQPVTMPVVQAAPGIFTGGVLNEDNSLNGPENPAAKGSVVIFWATGEGAVDTTLYDGQVIAAPYPKPVLQVNVKIGGIDAAVDYAGAAPFIVAGVMQVNARVPAGVSSGSAVPIRISVGGVPAAGPVTIAVK